MPPKRKRKATTEAGLDDASDDGATPASTKKKKMTAEEKAAARERARISMMGEGGPTPTKRRKVESNNGSSNKKSATPTKRAAAPASPAPAAAAAPASTTPGSSGRKTKKQKLQEARASAKKWAAEQEEKNKNNKAIISSPPAAATEEEVLNTRTSPRASRNTSTNNAASTTTAAAASRRRRTTAATETYDHGDTASTGSNVMPSPPRARGGRNSSRGSLSAPPPMVVAPAGANALERPSTVRVEQFQFTGSIDTGVRVPKSPKGNVVAVDDVVDAPTTPSWWEKIKKNKLFWFLVVASLGIFGLVTRGYVVWNSKSGMLMIMGSTQMEYRDGRYHSRIYPSIDDASSSPEKEYLLADICYFDSPQDMLQTLDAALLEAAPAIHCPGGGVQLPCPANAMCYKGMIVDCRGPVWQLAGSGTEKYCVLSQAINETYSSVVEFVQEWSIQPMCLNHVDGPKPISYYTYTRPVVEEASKREIVTIADYPETMMTNDEAIPLYTWTMIYREVEVPDEFDDWNWGLLKAANVIHQKLVLEEDGTSLLLGLSPEENAAVVANRLPSICKTRRQMKAGLDWVTGAILSISTSLLIYFYNLSRYCFTTVYNVSWHCFKTHPWWSLLISAVVWLLTKKYRSHLAKKRHLSRVAAVRLLALERLQDALSQAPGDGLRKGEVVVIHLRDSLSFALHETDHLKRLEFVQTVWPAVTRHIEGDNRVRKQLRPVDGVSRKVWMWVATGSSN